MTRLPRFPWMTCCTALATSLAASAAPATNPLVWADVPDVAALRVGRNYYISSTTMHMSPGLPIMKSTDLVNWMPVGYAYDTLADNDALSLRNGKNAYGSGSWASSLRYHEGTYYASTFSSNTGKTHIFATKDIEHGPWREWSFSPSLHDHSLFFEDDGRVYMVYGGGDIRLTELRRDLSGLKQGGEGTVIIKGAHLVASEASRTGLHAEGSQLHKINGRYYLFNICWPRGGMRTAIVHRADKLTGPYEGRVFLKDRGIAQGGLVDTPDGKWYAMLFQDSGAVGRIPHLVPVKWQDGWPVAVDGKAPDRLDLPARNGGMNGIVASDEFERKPGEPALPLAWQWNHNPDHEHWSLTARRGALRLTTGRVDADLLHARNTLTQRTFGPACSAATVIDAGQMKDGDCAGLCVLQRKYGYVGVKMEDGKRSVVMVSAASDKPQEVASIALDGTLVHLRVDCDFRNRADKARFYFSLDGKAWQPLGQALQMVYTLPHFMGYRFGLFNFATKDAGGYVDFDRFRLSDEVAP